MAVSSSVWSTGPSQISWQQAMQPLAPMTQQLQNYTNQAYTLAQPRPQDPYIASTLQQFESERQAANQANIQRYHEALSGYQGLVGQHAEAIGAVPEAYQNIADQYAQREQRLGGLLEGRGDYQRQMLEDARERQLAATQESLQKRGLYGSSIYDVMARGVEQDYARNRMALEEGITGQQMDYLAGLSGQTLAAQEMVPQAQAAAAESMFQAGQAPLQLMERREDIAPSLEQVGQYATAIGAGTPNLNLGGNTGGGPITVPGFPTPTAPSPNPAPKPKYALMRGMR